jgi:integrase
VGVNARPQARDLLTLEQARALLNAAEDTNLHAYVVVSLLNGARTEELRALTGDHVDLAGEPPSIEVWHSVREGRDTKTANRDGRSPCRSGASMPSGITAPAGRRQEKAGASWSDTGLVFTSQVGTELDAANVRRAFRRVIKAAGLDPKEWSPRELRHSFVSLLSSGGVPIEDIADLCGHSGTSVTEKIYRHQLRPVLLKGAVVMDQIFPASPDA